MITVLYRVECRLIQPGRFPTRSRTKLRAAELTTIRIPPAVRRRDFSVFLCGRIQTSASGLFSFQGICNNPSYVGLILLSARFAPDLFLSPIVRAHFQWNEWPSRFSRNRNSNEAMNSERHFESIVSEHYEALYRFAMSLTRSESDACDLTQHTFYIWATKGHQLRDISKAKTWLYTTLHRAFLQGRRTHVRYPRVEWDEIAEQLVISRTTVLAHLQRIKEKIEHRYTLLKRRNDI